MDTACNIMQLNGVVRLAVGLVKGVEIKFKEAPPAPAPPRPPPTPATPAPSLAPGTPAATPSAASGNVRPPQQQQQQRVAGRTQAPGAAGPVASSAAASAAAPPLVFEMAVFSVIAWFKVTRGGLRTGRAAHRRAHALGAKQVSRRRRPRARVLSVQVREHYQLGGPPGTFNRRDLRRGAEEAC